jgi:hypothetical protein
MRRPLPIYLAPLLAAALCPLPSGARAQSASDLSPINVTYHGGPLLQRVRVATLFWGPNWKTSRLPAYFNNFFRALFADGRFMANLAQYSAGGYQIDNGGLAATATDEKTLPARVTDAQIQVEIEAQVASGALPRPEADTLYFVFTPPRVVVVDRNGADSVHDFSGYHDYTPQGDAGFPYAVIPYSDTLGDARLETLPASHELAEAVTDPRPAPSTLGWYDDQNGEIGDVPVSLFAAGQIGQEEFVDVLEGPDGSRYAVQKEWSVQDGAPIAFAPTPAIPNALR